MTYPLSLEVDGQQHALDIDTRTTLLDLLRDSLAVMSPKKGCDHGQCGACTVLVDDRRIVSCLALAAQYDSARVTTAAGLTGDGLTGDGLTVDRLSDGSGEALHPMQEAFLEHDGYQCGYCTPGQICSAVGMLREVAAGHPSHVTADLTADVELDDEEIRERMSGNLCRCGAYVNIVAAIRAAASA